MTTLTSDEPFDPDHILSTLNKYAIRYVLVGGMAARAHGASRPTTDIDCVPDTSSDNLERLAQALRELGAKLRVANLSKDDIESLPIRLDGKTLAAFGSSTWSTLFGPIDLLVELRDLSGGRHGFQSLLERSFAVEINGAEVAVASLPDIINSKKFAARPKDFDALAELQHLLDSGK